MTLTEIHSSLNNALWQISVGSWDRFTIQHEIGMIESEWSAYEYAELGDFRNVIEDKLRLLISK